MRFILLTVALLVRARQFPVSFCVLQSLIKFRFSPTWDHLLPQILRIHLNIKEFLVQSALRIQLVIYTEDNPFIFSSSTYWGYPPYVFNFYILRIFSSDSTLYTPTTPASYEDRKFVLEHLREEQKKLTNLPLEKQVRFQGHQVIHRQCHSPFCDC